MKSKFLKKALQLSIKSVIISKLPKSIRAEKGLPAGKIREKCLNPLILGYFLCIILRYA